MVESVRNGKKRTRRKVALLMHTASDWTRQILRGVATFVHEQGSWDCCFEPRGYYEKLTLPHDWDGDGVITRLTHPEIGQAILEKGIPAVNVSWLGNHTPQIAKINSDEKACANLGVQYLFDRGYSHFGYLGPARRLGYTNEILATLREYTDAKGLGCDVFTPPNGNGPNTISDLRKKLAIWLDKIPKPVGILAWDSRGGCELSMACQALQLRVPEEVAIICIEHDHLASSLAPIPLSCIDQDPVRVGFEAAKLLDRLMNGATAAGSPLVVAPAGVIERESTGTKVVGDRLVAQVIEYIHNHLTQPLQVSDLQKHFPVSRRQLEMRFKKSLGHAPGAEIRRARLARVKRLLVETELSMAKVAELSGFEYTEVMMRAFKREFNYTPGDYRKKSLV